MSTLAWARMLSVLGGNAATTALVYLVFSLTGSSIWVTAAMLASTGVQSLALPFAGALADRIGPRTALLGSEAGSAVTAVALAGYLLAADERPVVVVLLTGLLALCQAAIGPSSAALVPALTDDLSRGNGRLAAATSIGRVGGPALGGLVLLVTGVPAVVLLHAACCLVAALVLLAVRPRGGAEPEPVGAGWRPWSSVGSSARLLRGSRRLRLLLWSSALAYAATSFAMIAEPEFAAENGAGGVGYAMMLAGWGAGLVAGAWLAGRAVPEQDEARALLRARVVMAAGILAVPLSPVFWLVPVVMFAGGAGSGALLVVSTSQIQRLVPAGSRGGVFGLMEGAGTAAFVAGVVAAGVLVEVLGVTAAYLVAGGGTLLAAIPLWLYVRRSAEPAPV